VKGSWVRVYEISVDSRMPKFGKVPFWVRYTFFRDGEPAHSGDRMVHAVDELDLFRVFPMQMEKRHGTNNVRWEMKGEGQPERFYSYEGAGND